MALRSISDETGREASGKVDRLDRLSDYQVADGEPDPRGWEVIGRDERTLGEVDHLVADTGSMRVRFLSVKLDRGVDSERRDVLIPIEHVELDTDAKRVLARGFEAGCMSSLPAWSGNALTREEEQQIVIACEQVYIGTLRDDHLRHPEDRVLDAPRVPGDGRRSDG